MPYRGFHRSRLQLLSPRLKSWTVSHRIDFDCELGHPIAIVVSNTNILLEEHVLSGPGVYERGLTDGMQIFVDSLAHPPLFLQLDIMNAEPTKELEGRAYSSPTVWWLQLIVHLLLSFQTEVLSRLIACLSVVTGGCCLAIDCLTLYWPFYSPRVLRRL